MRDLFFGAGAAAGWFIVSSVFAFCAAYVWQIVYEVGGVRGTALATTWTCLSIICSAFGLLLTDQILISHFVIGAIITAAFGPIVLAALVLTDLYAADRNGHRSFTARSYLWYKRVTKDDREEGDTRHAAAAQKSV